MLYFTDADMGTSLPSPASLPYVTEALCNDIAPTFIKVAAYLTQIGLTQHVSRKKLSFIKRTAYLAVGAVSLPLTAHAMVGKTKPASDPISRQVIMFTGSSGTFCSGTVIAQNLLLTAAHCVDPRDRYKLIRFSAEGNPVLLDVASAVRHPLFDKKAFLNHRATADVAVLKLGEPLDADYIPAALAPKDKVVSVGENITVAGYGVSVRGDGKTGGRLRLATLAVTGHPGSLQLRLVDPDGKNSFPGMGACTGDSGAPAFDARGAIIGVVSWSTAFNNEAGCGGLTGVTPLGKYREWLDEMLRTN